ADQQAAAFEFSDSLVGYELDCLIDDQIDETTWSGRIYADAPEIDATVYVQGNGVTVGDLTPVEIVGRRDYDLVAGVST
ncbi:MAG: 30S ribosomal protein S12 methylthiotransferase RimO, partial [Planctomycetota bacterium]